MEPSDAASELNDLYAAVYRFCHQRQSPRAHRASAETLAFLDHLKQTGPLTIKEAAAHFDRSQAATSELVQRLIERGLLDRIEDQRDRRRHLIWLTEQALELSHNARRPLSDELLAGCLARMKDGDRAQLVRTMRLLVDAAHAHANENRRNQ